MAEINLLGNDGIDPASITAKGLKVVSLLLLAVLLIVVLCYAYFSYSSWATGKEIVKTQEKTASATDEVLKNPKRLEVVTRQGQAKEINSLLNAHLYWSYLLPELSRVTLNTSGYSRINANDKGNLELTVVVANYDELDKYLQVFNLPEYFQQFSNVRVTSINKVNEDDQIKIEAAIKMDLDLKFLRDRIK